MFCSGKHQVTTAYGLHVITLCCSRFSEQKVAAWNFLFIVREVWKVKRALLRCKAESKHLF